MSTYALNKLIRDINRSPSVREEYFKDQVSLLDRYGLSVDERQALRSVDIGKLYQSFVTRGVLLDMVKYKGCDKDGHLPKDYPITAADLDGTAGHGAGQQHTAQCDLAAVGVRCASGTGRDRTVRAGVVARRLRARVLRPGPGADPRRQNATDHQSHTAVRGWHAEAAVRGPCPVEVRGLAGNPMWMAVVPLMRTAAAEKTRAPQPLPRGAARGGDLAGHGGAR